MGRPAIDVIVRLLGAGVILAVGAVADRALEGVVVAGLLLAPLAWLGASLGRKLLLLALWLVIAYVVSRWFSIDPDDGQYGFWVLGFAFWMLVAVAGTGLAVFVDSYLSTRRRIDELEAGRPPVP